MAAFDDRHRDLESTFRHHAAEVADRLAPGCSLSDTRRLLLGATFTSEYAIEAAALCNPSIVAHPDQTGVPTGSLRFVMSVRAIGEGHRSSIGFRTGTIDSTGDATVDAPAPFATTGTTSPATLEAAGFRSELERLGSDGEDADYVLDALGPRFSPAELDAQLVRLQGHLRTRRRGERTIALIRGIAERTYGVAFPADVPLSERVLWPSMSAESHGMEDARFVRFTHDDGSVVYFATYTAYDGAHITQQLLETTDFCTFTSTPIVGAAAANKGLALFPRRIHGRYAALSRHDRETNSVAFSDNPRQWPRASPCQAPDPRLGGAPARQLRLADRDRRRLARAHPRRRPDAHLQHRSDPPRPRRPDRRPRPAAAAPADTRPLTSATGTSRTSCTRAVRSSTPASSSCPTASATPPSASHPCPCPRSCRP